MSDSDIYKKREPLATPRAGTAVRPSHRRRKKKSNTVELFDDKNRKRRSKNTGIRRLFHLYRKQDREKAFWGGLAAIIVVLLVVIAVWQYWYIDWAVQQDFLKNEKIEADSSTTE